MISRRPPPPPCTLFAAGALLALGPCRRGKWLYDGLDPRRRRTRPCSSEAPTKVTRPDARLELHEPRQGSTRWGGGGSLCLPQEPLVANVVGALAQLRWIRQVARPALTQSSSGNRARVLRGGVKVLDADPKLAWMATTSRQTWRTTLGPSVRRSCAPARLTISNGLASRPIWSSPSPSFPSWSVHSSDRRRRPRRSTAITRYPSFTTRCFTQAERPCNSRAQDPALLCRLAVGKALGFGVAKVAWREVEITGRPKPSVHGRLEEQAAHLGVGRGTSR